MHADHSEEKFREAEKGLGEPVLAEFSDELAKSKRNLLLVSSVVLFIGFSEIRIDEINILGVKFGIPEASYLNWALVVVVSYFLIQFLWLIFDYIHHAQLRLTGTRVSHVTSAKVASSFGDYPDNPAQSSLYNFWLNGSKTVQQLHEMRDLIADAIKHVEEASEKPTIKENPNINEVLRAAHRLRDNLTKLETSQTKLADVLNSERIPVSLARFDKWFWRYKKSQSWRIVLLDLCLPTLTAICALGITICDLICSNIRHFIAG